ncbi:MAG: GreA/GreB family elongation factor [Spirosomataceae bacterium]
MKYFFLKEDLDCLMNKCNKLLEEHKEIGKSVGEATSQSSETWHDNAVFDIAREAGRLLENRIQKLYQVINNATIVLPPISSSKQIVIGSIVKVRYKGNLNEVWFKVGSYEVPNNNSTIIHDRKVITISYVSPIGDSLLGKTIGDVVFFSVDGGKTHRELSVLEVVNSG